MTVTGSLRTFLVPVAALIALWLAYRWWFPDDATQIRVVLERIAEGVGSSAEESEMGRLARAAGLRNDLHPEIEVDAGPPFVRMKGRESVIATAARLNGVIRNLSIVFRDIDIDVAGDEATVRLTAEAHFDEGRGGRGMEAREFDVAFVRREGRWVIADVRAQRPIEPLTTP